LPIDGCLSRVADLSAPAPAEARRRSRRARRGHAVMAWRRLPSIIGHSVRGRAGPDGPPAAGPRALHHGRPAGAAPRALRHGRTQRPAAQRPLYRAARLSQASQWVRGQGRPSRWVTRPGPCGRPATAVRSCSLAAARIDRPCAAVGILGVISVFKRRSVTAEMPSSYDGPADAEGRCHGQRHPRACRPAGHGRADAEGLPREACPGRCVWSGSSRN
jgi:hypothetical protein